MFYVIRRLNDVEMRTYLYVLSIVLLVACDQQKIKMKKEYYSNGNLKSMVYYLNDSIPVDSGYYYYVSGKLFSAGYYDSGLLSGNAFVFFENGKLKEKLSYSRNKLEGFCVYYDSAFDKCDSFFYYNDSSAGDCYQKISGRVRSYAFIDFNHGKINQVDYDDKGLVVNDVRDKVFFSSVTPLSKDSNVYSYRINLFVSNPPFTSNKIVVNCIGFTGSVIKTDTLNINRASFCSIVKRADSSLHAFELFAVQYDSVLNKYYSQKEVNKLNYLKNN